MSDSASTVQASAIDLYFGNLQERDRQYNARASVDDFDACAREYEVLSASARAQCAGLLDLRYGMGPAERLDLFPVPGATKPTPLLIFIHGGYWRSQTKENSAMMCKVFTDAGIAVAVVEYPLLPAATLAEAVREVRSAVAWLHENAERHGIDRARIYASGSSAGAHLTGMLIAPGWQQEYGLSQDVIRGALCLSGLYDIAPLCDISVNTWLRLIPEQARLLSPLNFLPAKPLPLILAVGGLETDGFKNQTAAYESAWRAKGWPVTRVQAPECNHFNLLNELAKPESPLTRAALAMVLQAAVR